LAVPRAALAQVSVTVEMTERISWLHHETQLAAPNARLSRSAPASTLSNDDASAAQRRASARRGRATARPGWRRRSGGGARACAAIGAWCTARRWRLDAPEAHAVAQATTKNRIAILRVEVGSKQRVRLSLGSKRSVSGASA
jgi:hypothetical protein